MQTLSRYVGALSVDTLGVEVLLQNLEYDEPVVDGVGGFLALFTAPFAFFHFLPFLSRSVYLALVGWLGFVEVAVLMAIGQLFLDPLSEEFMNDSRKQSLFLLLVLIYVSYMVEQFTNAFLGQYVFLITLGLIAFLFFDA